MKKWTRRVVNVGLAGCMVLTMAACGRAGQGKDEPLEQNDKTIVILEPEPLPTEESVWMTEDEKSGSGTMGSESSEMIASGATGEASSSDGESAATAEDDKISITISAAGDVTLGNTHVQDYSYSFRQMYDSVEDKSYFFENVYEYFSRDDMSIVNLEGTLTLAEEMREGATYNIKGDPEYAQILTLGSVEAVSMANNHRRDYLEQGSADTVAALESEGIIWAYDNHVGIYETKDVKIGIISVNWVAYGRGIMNFVEKGMQKLEEAGADLKIVCCHWGIEREYLPNQDQMDLGKQCIDAGADLVLGHHPHVLQGIEEYRGRYIVYSMGNFCFGANRNPADKDTMIFRQTFILEEGQDIVYGEAQVIPCSVSSVKNRNDYKPTPAEGDEYTRILQKINQNSKYFGVAADEEGRLISVPAEPWPEESTSEENATEAETGA